MWLRSVQAGSEDEGWVTDSGSDGDGGDIAAAWADRLPAWARRRPR